MRGRCARGRSSVITINADSLAASIAYARKKGIEARTMALLQYRQKVMAMYIELLLITPQYSSDMVYNWDIETENTHARSYVRSPEKVEFTAVRGEHPAPPHEAGDQDTSFMAAKMRGLRRMQDITYYGQPVYFVNAALLEIDSPLIIDDTGVHQELRDSDVIFAWASITSYLQERFGAAQ